MNSTNGLTFMMHPFPCSALFNCFGSVRENAPFDQPELNCLAAAEGQNTKRNSALCGQPSAKATDLPCHPEEEGEEFFPGKNSRTIANSNASHCISAQLVSAVTDLSAFPVKGLLYGTVPVHTHIPRPSIIGMPKVSAGKCYYVQKKNSIGLID